MENLRKGPVRTTGTHQFDDKVTLRFGNNADAITIPGCRIAAVKHYENNVKYDVVVPVTGYVNFTETVIYEVEGIYVIPEENAS